MTAAKALFGLRPARQKGSGAGTGGISRYRIDPAGYATAIFRGDPVLLTAGYVMKVSASTDYALGMFMGCEYNDPTTKKRIFSRYYPANTSVGTDPYGITALVVDDYDRTFIIQADASVSVGDVGLNFEVTLGAGSTQSGNSGIGLKASTRQPSLSLLRVVDLWEAPDNAWSDAFTVVEVQWVMHRNARLSAS